MAESGEVEDRFRIHQDAIVCKEASLRGSVTVGAGCIVHPGARIHALGGPIVLGSSNLVEEGVLIETAPDGNGVGAVMNVGNYNSFQVGCVVRCAVVGDGNVVEAKAVLETQTVLGSGAIVGATVRVPPRHGVDDNTVLYGSSGGIRTVENGAEKNTNDLEPRLAQLRKILPASHKLIS